MSVRCFDAAEISKLAGAVYYECLNRSGAVYYAVRYSRVAGSKERTLQMLGKMNEDDLVKEVVGRLFWYVWVANKTSYALQYKEEPGFFEDADLFEVNSCPMNRVTLWGDLGNLRYNLATNDGNTFLNEQYEELFDDVRNALASEVMRAKEAAA